MHSTCASRKLQSAASPQPVPGPPFARTKHRNTHIMARGRHLGHAPVALVRLALDQRGGAESDRRRPRRLPLGTLARQLPGLVRLVDWRSRDAAPRRAFVHSLDPGFLTTFGL